jgi:PAS domain S-box-containing protein
LATKFREDDNRLIVNKKSEEMEEQYIQSGQQAWVHMVKTPVINGNDDVIGILGIFWDITEHKLAEIALRESEERLRIFIEHAPTALAMFDREMRYLAMSQRWMTDYGLSYHNIIGRSQFELFPDIPDQWKKVYQRGLNGEVIRAEEDRFLLMDGTVQWLRWEVRPWFADIGNVGGIVIFTENITARKHSENALRQSEERFRKIFENAAIGIAITDWEGNFQQCNPFYCTMLGYTMEELRRVLFFSHICQEDREAYKAEIRRLRAGEIKSFEIENRYIRKDGHQIWGRKFVSILTDDNGKPAHLLGLVSDTTERRHAENALRQSEERFRKVYEHAAMGIAITDWEGRYLQCNPAFCHLLGYTEEEFRKMTIPITVHPDDWENYLTKIRSLQAGEIPFFEIENRCVHKNGHFLWEHKYISVLTDETGKPAYLLGLTTNVTERKQAEDALVESKERLRLATKVANLGTYDWDLQTNYAIFSSEWKHQLGYGESEISNRYEEWEKRLHPNDRERVLSTLRNYLDGSIPEYETEFRLRHKNGFYRWIYTKGAKICDSDGKPYRMLGCHLDITERKQTGESLSAEKERLAITLRSIGDGVITTDINYKIITINNAGEKTTGWTQDDAFGKHLEEVFNVVDELSGKKIPVSEMKVFSDNAKLITHDGQMIDIAGSCEPIIDNNGRTQGIVLVFQNITERKKYEFNLKSSLRQKEVLLQELYHRTKNNMQVISALLELQAMSSESEEVKRIIRDSQTRIHAMALAHEKLYRSKNLSYVNMEEYIPELAKSLMNSYSISQQRVQIIYNIHNAKLLIDIAIPCGLIITELLSNSFKYAFPENREGQINISLNKTNINQIELTIADNGIGLPPNFDISTSTSLGIQLVLQMVDHQLHGDANVVSDNGVHWFVRFRSDIYSVRV